MKKAILAATVAVPAMLGLTAVDSIADQTPVTLDGIAVGDVIGTTLGGINDTITGLGYKITEFEIEDDEIEVELTANDRSYELEIDPESGKVVDIELEDRD